ncbi:MAG: hypothetical protein JRG91_13995 [Deltaproteobacteria bacterium]|nr:hypothetical protein [Deltaproteobacteria bacterium]
MHQSKSFALLACAALLWACATDFTIDNDADDGTSDPAGDTDATLDGEDVSPDVPTDGPEDVPTDEPPPSVECRLDRTKDFLFPTGYGGTNIEAGCWSSGGDFGCQQGNVWITRLGSRLVVLYGGDQIIMGATARAAADVIELTDLDLMGTTPADSDFGIAYANRISDATLVRRTEDEIILIYTVDERESSGFDRESNIEVVVFDNLTGGTLDVMMNRLFETPVHESTGDLVLPSAVMSPTTGRSHIFFGIRVDGGEGWEHMQIWGNFMNPGGLRTGSFTSYTDFEPVVGDYSQMMFTARPDCIDEMVVLPWTEASLTPPLLRSGVVVIDTGTPGGYGPYVSSIAGAWRTPYEYAAAALSTSALTMLGLNPPYDVVSAVADASTVSDTVEAEAVHSVDEPFISEMDFFDFNDPVVLHQPGSPVHFFVHPFFHTSDGDTGHAWIFPLGPDGTPAGEPFALSMDQEIPPAFDATIDEGNGHIFLAWMHDTPDPTVLERIPGYTIAEIICE